MIKRAAVAKFVFGVVLMFFVGAALAVAQLAINNESALPALLLGEESSVSLQGSGGTAPYQWSLYSGTLPQGMSLSAATGQISGTPGAIGLSNFTIQIQDAATRKVRKSFSLRVNPDNPRITAGILAEGVTVEPYSHQFVATLGKPPYTWSTTSPLPTGLSLSSAGLLSGTPSLTSAGNYSIAVKATGVNGQSGTARFSLVVRLSEAPAITTGAVLPGGTMGQAYSGVVFQATGGKKPYSWALASGPTGLVLSSNGSLSGYPAVASVNGTALPLKVRVTGADGRMVVGTFSIVVAPTSSPVISTAELLPGARVGVLYRAALLVSGGSAPYTFEEASELPTWLTLSVAGVLTGTPPVAASEEFLVRVRGGNGASSVKRFVLKSLVLATPMITGPVSLSVPQGVAMTVPVTAVGGKTPYSWSIASGTLPTGITLNATSGVLQGTPSTVATSNFTTRVTDANGKSHTLAQKMAVVPNVPIITRTPLAPATTGTVFSHSFNATSGKTPYTWSTTTALPAGMTLSSAGVLSGTPAHSASGNHSIAVKATGANGLSQTVRFPWSVVLTEAPTITTATVLPGGTVGQPYSGVVFQATGGKPPYSWSLVSGPEGLRISANGSMSGYPAVASVNGTALPVKVRVTAADGRVATGTFTIVVASGNAPAFSTAEILPGARIGLAYRGVLAATGGVSPYTFEAVSSLPQGLSLSAAGFLSGVLAAEETHTFLLRVRGSNGASAIKEFTLKVTPSPVPVTTGPARISATNGVALNEPITTVGGATPYSWALSSGSLPAGISLNGTTGRISGTPLALATANFSTTVTDANGKTHTFAHALSVLPNRPMISSAVLPTALTGDAYNHVFQATGGKTPYSWSATTTLPAGLSLSTNGTLSGTPLIEAVGNHTLSIRVTGATGDASTVRFPLQILRSDVLAITTSNFSAGQVGQAYSTALARTGGIAPYQWSVDALPPGISLNSANGTLSGTPTGSFTKNAIVRVTDSKGKSATRSLAWGISNPAEFRITSASLRPVRSSTAYSHPLATQNGQSPVQWTIVSGRLPTGLSLSSNGVISGTSSESGNFTFTVRATEARGFTASRAMALRVGDFAVDAPPDSSGRLFTEITEFVSGMPPHRVIAVSDFDNDGHDDLLVSTSLPVPVLPNEESLSDVRLWKFTGPWKITDITEQAGLVGVRPVLVADFDNDGVSDIFHIDQARTQAALFRNSGNGVFEKQELPGLLADELASYISVKSADIDLDGDLDLLFSVNEPEASGAIVQVLNQANVSQDANPLFTTKSYIVRVDFLNPRLSISDPDSNAKPDLIMVPTGGNLSANYRNGYTGKLVYNNLTWFYHSTNSGITTASPYSAFLSWDLDNNGWLDLLNGSSDWFDKSKPTFQTNPGGGRFYEKISPVGHGNGSIHLDAALFDADLDADLDAIWTGVRSAAAFSSKIWENKQTYMLASGNSSVDPTVAFNNSTSAWGLSHALPGNGLHHSAGYAADLDEDGDLDLVLWAKNANSADHRYMVYRNDANLRNPSWLKVELMGAMAPTQGTGALVDVEIPAGTLYPPNADSVTPASGQLQSGKIRLTQRMGDDTGSVHGSRLHFGLAGAASANITVTWPGNIKYTLSNVPANQTVQISEFPALDGVDSDSDGISDARELGYGRYDIIDGAMDWESAKSAAEARGGHLATINSAEEWNRIQQVLGSRLVGRVLWIGATQGGQSGWGWITGEKWSHAAWAQGMPGSGDLRGVLESDGSWSSSTVASGRVSGYLFESGALTNPKRADSDFDGYNDSAEISAESDPNDNTSVPVSEASVVAPFIPSSVKDVRVLTPEWICAVVDTTEEILAARYARYGSALEADKAAYEADVAAGKSNWYFAFSKNFRTLNVQRSYHLPLFAKFNKASFWTVNNQAPADITVWSHSVDGMPGWTASDIPTADTFNYSRTADMIYLKLPSAIQSGTNLEVRSADGRVRSLAFNDHSTPCWSIKVNQSAYDRSAEKKAAYLGMWLPGIGGADFSAFEGQAFHIKAYQAGDRWDRGTAVGAALFTGNITLRKAFADQDVVREGGSNLTGENVYELDFSAFQGEGTYCIHIPGLGRSWPFKVTSGGYGEAFYWMMKGLYTQRCGIELKQPYSAWARPCCHEHTYQGQFIPETTNFYTTGYRSGNLSFGFRDAAGNRTAVAQFTLIGNSLANSPLLPGVKGGWHDAADFDRRIHHYNVVWDLLAAYEASPAKFTDSQLHIPESGNGIPDILDEAAFGVDVWKATQRFDGGVSSWLEQENHPGPVPNNMQSAFAENQMTMFSAVPDRTGSFTYAVAAAWLGRLIAPYDSARSAAYIQSARSAYAFAKDSAKTMSGLTFTITRAMRDAKLLGQTIRFDEDPVIYDNDPAYIEKALASMAIYQATGEQTYLNDWTASNLGSRFGTFSWRISGSRVVPLLRNVGLTANETTAITNNIVQTADGYLNAQNNHPYRMYWYAPQDGWFYTLSWGAFHQKTRLLTAAFVATGDPKYKTAMQSAADFFLGCNPMGSSLVSGIGSVYPVVLQHIHSLSDGVVEPTPGIAPYTLTYGVQINPFVIAHQGHSSVSSYYQPTAMAFLPDRLGREQIQADLDSYPKVGNWSSGASQPARNTIWNNFPILRRKNTHPGAAVDQNEFTVTETSGPLALLFGMLTNEGWMPSQEIKTRQPKLTPEEVPFYSMP